MKSFFWRWHRRLPSPLTREDLRAGYVYELAFRQFEVSDTRVFDRPAAGRAFFEQLIRDHLDVGRPDSVSLIFDRRVTRRTPGAFRTKVITNGVDPQVTCYYKSSRIKQYFKEHRALRTETVICDTRDFGIGRRVTAENWRALRAVGEAANQRLCDAQAADARPAPDVATFAEVTRPSVVDGQHAPGLRFGDPRVMAVLAAIVGFTHLLAGFDNPTLARLVSDPARPALHQPAGHLRPASAPPQRPDHPTAWQPPLPADPTRQAGRGPVHQDLRTRTGSRPRGARPAPTRRAVQTQSAGDSVETTGPDPRSLHSRRGRRCMIAQLDLTVNRGAAKRSEGPPITSFVCEQEAAPARPTTSGMDNSSAVRGGPWTRVDGSFAPCPLSTSGPALGHEGDLRTRRARHPALEPTMNGAPALATRPTGRELCNYHIPATTPANGHPGPADRRHRPADRRLTDGP